MTAPSINPPRYRAGNIPAQLKMIPQWINFAIEGKQKIPLIAGYGYSKAKSNDPTTWRTFNEALASAEKYTRYLGFCFTPDLGMTFLDFDGVVGAGSMVKQYAQLVIDTLDSYTEVSINNGIHVFVEGRPPKHFTKDGVGGKVEVYPLEGARFCLVTGDMRPGLGSMHGTIELCETALATLFPVRSETDGGKAARKTSGAGAALTEAEMGAIVAAFAPYWVEGQKHDMRLAVAGFLGKNSVPEDQIRTIIRRLQVDDNKPKDGEKAIDDTMRRLADGLDVKGYNALIDIVPDEARTIVDGILQRIYAAARPRLSIGGKEQKKIDAAAASLADPDSIRLTDLGNARRLVAMCGADIRYCYERDQWLMWDGRRWQWDMAGAVERLAKKTAEQMIRDAADLPAGKEQHTLLQHAEKSQHVARLHAMMALAQSEPGIPISMNDLDASPSIISCLNGTIDLETGELREHRRDDLATRLLEITYDPLDDAPKWTAFLNQMVPDADIRGWIQQYLGKGLAGKTGAHIVPIAYGEGGNGKSTIVDVVSGTLGPYVTHANIETFLVSRSQPDGSSATPDIARLKGARIVMASESDSGRKLNVARIKDLSGGEPITARELYGKPFSFKPYFSMWLSTNNKPDVPGNDYALWRRLRLIPFEVKIDLKKKIDDLDQIILAEEKSGVLNWVLDGLKAWQRAGGRLPSVAAIEGATEQYRYEYDVIGQWISVRCEVSRGLTESASSLYLDFKSWFEQLEPSRKPMSQTMFGRELEKKGYTKEMVGSGLIFRNGLRLNVSAT